MWQKKLVVLAVAEASNTIAQTADFSNPLKRKQ